MNQAEYLEYLRYNDFTEVLARKRANIAPTLGTAATNLLLVPVLGGVIEASAPRSFEAKETTPAPEPFTRDMGETALASVTDIRSFQAADHPPVTRAAEHAVDARAAA